MYLRREFVVSFFRTICEVALYPETDDGVLGEMFNLLLSPTEDLHDNQHGQFKRAI